MFFTQDDYRKIEEWLRIRTIKDTQFPNADPLTGFEKVPIIQDGKNKTMDLDKFIRELSLMELPDFLNVTTFTKRGHLRLEEAVSSIPVEQRKLGLTITYHSEKGNWMIYQFKGTSLNQWDSLNYWRSIVEEAIEEFVYHPDEEDITAVRDGNRSFLKFKDKDYDPAEFSGMGRIILRKNLVGTEACSLDDEDHLLNILTQDMIREENTIYIVQYDFDLDGKVISIPKGCTLWFQGGSINNGSIYLQETAILGAFEFADMGNAKLFGKFNTGQVMTFSDDSYKAKTGGYFIATTKASSATTEEDAKNERETFYDKNPNTYTTETRQELRWWNGKEWILILDITDYNEIKSIINDFIEKHNAEMSACYKYFKARCYALESRVDEAERRLDAAEDRLDEHDTTLADYKVRLDEHDVKLEEHTNTLNTHESRLDNHDTTLNNHQTTLNNHESELNNHENRITKNEGDITSINSEISSINNDIVTINNDISEINTSVANLSTSITNLGNSIENRITEYITNNIIGVISITVNGTKYDYDSNGNITLPPYPKEAESTKGTLTIQTASGANLGTFNGSSNKTITIPEGEGGSGTTIITAKETLTIKKGDISLGTYDGTEAKTITIPESEGGAKGTLTLKQGNTTLGTYDGTEAQTITIPEVIPGGGIADKVANKLKFTGAATVEYDGSEEVTVNIPTGGGGGTSTPNQPLIFTGAVEETYDGTSQKTVRIPSIDDLDTKNLTIKDSEGNVVVTYNAKEDKELQVRKIHVKTNLNDTIGELPSGVIDTFGSGSLIPHDIDLLKESARIDLTKLNFGTETHPIVLYAAQIERVNNKSSWGARKVIKHPFVSATIALEGKAAVKISLASAGDYMSIDNAIAVYRDSTERGITDSDYNRNRSAVVGLRCAVSGKDIYVQGIRTADKNNDSIDFDPAAPGGKLLGFNLIVLGYINR